jgi:hypothetical protein
MYTIFPNTHLVDTVIQQLLGLFDVKCHYKATVEF